MSKPFPVTRTALLVSEGYKTVRKPTRHEYVRTELAAYRPRAKDEAPGEMYVFVFRCEETGVERRWGSETAPRARKRTPAAPAPAPAAPAPEGTAA